MYSKSFPFLFTFSHFKKGNQVNVTIHVAVPAETPMSVVAGNLVLARILPNGKVMEVWRAESFRMQLTFSNIPLPPDPGIAGELTIQGIDRDQNGVRDDIDRWIAFTAPNSEKQRVALTLSAKAQQNFMLDYLANVGQNPNDEAVIKRVRGLADLRIKTEYCLSYVFGVRAGFSSDDVSWNAYSTKSRELEALFMDSPDRIRAFWESEKPLDATSGPILEPNQYKQQCLDLGFDPDQLPN